MNLRKMFAWLFVLALFLPGILSAQITITAQDLLGQIGSRQVGLEDQRSSIPVDVGSPGANQVWDFRMQNVVDTLFSVSEYLAPDETVSAGTFPEANMVQKITTPEAPTSKLFNFFNITSDFFIGLGDSSRITTPFDTSFVFFQNDTLAPLPVAFGNSWLTTERDTTGLFPLSANISIDTTLNTVDGWGTMRLPLGDFDCLRLRQDVKVINQSIINGVVFSTAVDSFIQYDWINKDIFRLASAQSQNNDMNPNFTNAQGFGRLDSLATIPPTSVREPELAIPGQFSLKQNYPNPFNPETLIQYDLDQTGPVELAIFNLLGEKMRSLVDQVQRAGAYQIRWNGLDDNGNRASSGLYVYRLTSGASSQTKRMVLLR